jgi:hypothetical protein
MVSAEHFRLPDSPVPSAFCLPQYRSQSTNSPTATSVSQYWLMTFHGGARHILIKHYNRTDREPPADCLRIPQERVIALAAVTQKNLTQGVSK